MGLVGYNVRCFIRVGCVVRNTGIAVQPEHVALYIELKGNNPCPAPVAAAVMLDGEIPVLDYNAGIRIAKNTAAPFAKHHAVIPCQQGITAISRSGQQQQRPRGVRIHFLAVAL